MGLKAAANVRTVYFVYLNEEIMYWKCLIQHVQCRCSYKSPKEQRVARGGKRR